jgi:hypothetical protein
MSQKASKYNKDNRLHEVLDASLSGTDEISRDEVFFG